jgi:sortase A
VSDQGVDHGAWGRDERSELIDAISRDAPTEVIPRVAGDQSPADSLDLPGSDSDSGKNEPPHSRHARGAAADPNRARNQRLFALSVVGELMITVGAFLALFVVYTLWWTNVVAHKEAQQESSSIEHQLQLGFKPPAKPGQTALPAPTTFQPSQGFGLMTIPAIGKKDLPIMQGTDKATVLDKGAVGHYTDPKTAMPWDATGNFAVAAHRRTHDEPFRYINKLQVGDHVIVETAQGWFVYQLDKELPQTDPGNIGVIAPIPKGGPYTKPGRYITLTTCTPEWASTYRLIWWGHLVRVDPLSGPAPAELNGR